jgi:transposase-like protein
MTTEVVDDGRRPDRLGRVRTPQSRREELLAEYERSGLSQAAFARRAGASYPTFAHWVQQRRRASGGYAETAPLTPAVPAPRFVELRLPGTPTMPTTPSAAPAAELSVTLPDGVVLRGAEPSALAALARALREA